MSERRVVAARSAVRLEVCACGGWYLTIGPVTMALQLSAIEEIGGTIADALRTLRAQRALADLGGRGENAEASSGADVEGDLAGPSPGGERN